MRRIPACLLVLALLSLDAPMPGARAGLLYVASPEAVTDVADHVVRGRLTADGKSVVVEASYSKGGPQGTIPVHNLPDRPAKPGNLAMFGARPATELAVLFLREMDGRFTLVESASPLWIRPEAALLYLTSKGEVLGYTQAFNPGPLVVVAKSFDRRTLEANLAKWLAKKDATVARPALTPAQAAVFYGAIEPWINLHTGEVRERRLGDDAARVLVGTLGRGAMASKGLLRQRYLEALTVLARKRGPDQTRRRLCEAQFEAFLAAHGPSELVALLLELCARESTSAHKRLAGTLLRRIGDPAREQGRKLLLTCMECEDENVVTNAYWGLVGMGFRADAEAAQAKRLEAK